jgi:Transglutaminase-like superfamily
MKKLLWRSILLIVVVTWGVMMLDLALEKKGGVKSLFEGERENTVGYSASATSASSAALGGLAEESWFSIIFRNNKIGYSHNIFRREGQGFIFKDKTKMRINMMGANQDIETSTDAWLSEDYQLQRFVFSLVSPTTSITVEGTLEGTTLALKIDSAGSVTNQSLQLAERPHLAMEIYPILARGDIKPGMEFELSVFDPATLANDTMRVTVVEESTIKVGTETIPAYRIRSEFKNNESEAWVDRFGNLIREDSPIGFRILRVTEQQAVNDKFGGAVSLDILDAVSIVVSRSIFNPRQTTMLRLTLIGDTVNNFAFNDQRQVFEDGILTVHVEKLEDYPVGQTLPIKIEPELQRFTQPAPFVQSANPEIIAAAREIIGDEADAMQAARLLVEWVYDEVEKVPTLSLPSAYEVLKIKKGDCNEHAVLTTALARAVGIPAETVVGLVYLEGRFYYHAWVQLYLGEWIAVDPAFGQFPADATHLRFVTGSLSKQVEIVSIMGRLKIDVLESKR